jgi:uncharacterized protein YlxW (UPF0749 family)
MNIQLDNIVFLAFFVLMGIILLIGVAWAFITEKRLKKFFLGKKAKDLEETMLSLESEIRALQKSKDNIESELKEVNTKLRKSIRGLETIRFNPFPDQGGNQSFAIGMLDEEGDGLVISSLYSRDRMSVFAKPVKKGASEYELTAEEKEALNKAKV